MLWLREVTRRRKNGQRHTRRFTIETRCPHEKQAARNLRLSKYLATGGNRRYISRRKALSLIKAIEQETDRLHAVELLRRPLDCSLRTERKF